MGSATVTDSAMDQQDFSLADRCTFLGGGYFLFCLIVGGMTTAIPLLYAAKVGVIPHTGGTLRR